MIWSVSMLVAGMTTVRDRILVTGCMCCGFPDSVQELARIRDPTADCGRGCGRRAREQRPRAGALTAFEIAIARAHAVLPGRDQVAVHAEAHRTAGFAPLGPGVDEHLSDSAPLGLELDLLRSRDDERAHAARHLAAGHDLC